MGGSGRGAVVTYFGAVSRRLSSRKTHTYYIYIYIYIYKYEACPENKDTSRVG